MQPITPAEAQSIVGGEDDQIYPGMITYFAAEQRDYSLTQNPRRMWVNELIWLLNISEA